MVDLEGWLGKDRNIEHHTPFLFMLVPRSLNCR